MGCIRRLDTIVDMVVTRGQIIGKEHTRTGDTAIEVLVVIPDWRAKLPSRSSMRIRRRHVPGLERVSPSTPAAREQAHADAVPTRRKRRA